MLSHSTWRYNGRLRLHRPNLPAQRAHYGRRPCAPGAPHARTGTAARVYIYRRTGEPCLVCGTAVATAAHAERKRYWCPSCQQRP